MYPDTIAALATPAGRGGVGIVRVSGVAVVQVAQALLGFLPSPRYATLASFSDKTCQKIDEGIALYFPGPNSFTGEDVLELQGHGGPVVMDLLLQAVLAVPGVRMARPGEFSERAFLNEKIDLIQAEAIADLINADSAQAARSALKSLEGDFSKAIANLLASLIELRMFVEAAIDFPEEEIDFLSDGKVLAKLTALKGCLEETLLKSRQGSLLREGMTLVISGRPNVGKSSLLNLLSGKDSAIVTDVPGTTRDIIREQIEINGIPVHLLDTAGLRESADLVEQEGMRRAKAAFRLADHVILMADAQHLTDLTADLQFLQKDLSAEVPVTLLINKIDLLREQPRCAQTLFGSRQIFTIYLSVKNQEGIDLLKERLLESLGYQPQTEGVWMARRRHVNALEKAKEALLRAEQQLCEFKAGELVAEELRVSQQALSEITGEFTADDLLGEIFSRFCIGK